MDVIIFVIIYVKNVQSLVQFLNSLFPERIVHYAFHLICPEVNSLYVVITVRKCTITTGTTERPTIGTKKTLRQNAQDRRHGYAQGPRRERWQSWLAWSASSPRRPCRLAGGDGMAQQLREARGG
jgi:hypothetical protein